MAESIWIWEILGRCILELAPEDLDAALAAALAWLRQQLPGIQRWGGWDGTFINIRILRIYLYGFNGS